MENEFWTLAMATISNLLPRSWCDHCRKCRPSYFVGHASDTLFHLGGHVPDWIVRRQSQNSTPHIRSVYIFTCCNNIHFYRSQYFKLFGLAGFSSICRTIRSTRVLLATMSCGQRTRRMSWTRRISPVTANFMTISYSHQQTFSSATAAPSRLLNSLLVTLNKINCI